MAKDREMEAEKLAATAEEGTPAPEAEAAMTDTLQRKHINYRGLYCHGYKMSESNKDELDKLLL